MIRPDHELATQQHLQEALPGGPVSLSSHLAPIWREYERASTTIADAYLKPLMSRYIGDLQARLASGGLASEWSLMKSNGGMLPASVVPENPIHTIMSGPAGGMIACKYFAGLADAAQIVTLDMGGTSADVGLLVALVKRYGLATMREASEELMRLAEQRMREEIRRIPDGTYRFEDVIEDDGVTDRAHTIRLAVTVEGDRLIADFTGTDPQAAGPTNCTYGSTASAVYNALFQLTDPTIPKNDGCYRPVQIIAPPDTIVNVVHPGAEVAGHTEVNPRLTFIMIGALAQALPERVVAADGGISCNFLFGGVHPDSGRSPASTWRASSPTGAASSWMTGAAWPSSAMRRARSSWASPRSCGPGQPAEPQPPAATVGAGAPAAPAAARWAGGVAVPSGLARGSRAAWW